MPNPSVVNHADNCIQIIVDALDRSAYYLNHKVSRMVYFENITDDLTISKGGELMGNYRKARERKGYTAQEAATRLGVSITTLGSWENGHTSPTAQRLIQLCKLYECTADELLGIVPFAAA